MEQLGFENDFFDASVDFERFDHFLDEMVLGLFERSVGNHDDRLVGDGAVAGHGNDIRRNLVDIDLKTQPNNKKSKNCNQIKIHSTFLLMRIYLGVSRSSHLEMEVIQRFLGLQNSDIGVGLSRFGADDSRRCISRRRRSRRARAIDHVVVGDGSVRGRGGCRSCGHRRRSGRYGVHGHVVDAVDDSRAGHVSIFLLFGCRQVGDGCVHTALFHNVDLKPKTKVNR